MRRITSRALLCWDTVLDGTDILGFVALARTPDRGFMTVFLTVHRHGSSLDRVANQGKPRTAPCICLVDVIFWCVSVCGTGRLGNGTCKRYRLIGGLKGVMQELCLENIYAPRWSTYSPYICRRAFMLPFITRSSCCFILA